MKTRLNIRWWWVAAGLFAGARVASAGAGLAWEAAEAFVTVGTKERVAVAEYKFRNTSDHRVGIVAVASSCDCVTASADKPAYAPGEVGVVRVVFTLGGREGPQEKSVMVTTDDAPGYQKRLLFTVNIPEPLAIRPARIFWQVGEAADEKVITLTALTPAAVVIGEVQCAETSFSARLEPLSTAGQYRVLIKPAATNKPVQATLRLSATLDGQPQVFVLYAAVR